MEMLETYGTEIGEPHVKHIQSEGQIYELRPLRDRFFFFYKQENRYIILNHLQKKTQKTPKKEIQKALRLIKSFNERNL